MANENNPNGFHPVRMAGVRPPTEYPIEVTYSEDLFIGQMVTLSSGYIVKATAGAGNSLLGAIVGFRCAQGIRKGGYYPDDDANTWYAIVADDPSQRFIAQDDAGGTLSVANIGETVNLKLTHAGNTTTNMAGDEIDSSATNGAVTDQFRIIGLVDKPGNAWGVNAELVVEIHNHVLRQENNVDAT